MPAGEQGPKTSRKHVTTACKPCRRSKIKCDGEAPTCANCTRRALHCQYQDGDDKRKLPFRLALGRMRTHIHELHSLLVANACQSLLPTISPPDLNMINRTLRGIGLEPLDDPENCGPNASTSNLPSFEPAMPEESTFIQPNDSVPAVASESGQRIDDYIASLDSVDWNSYLSSPDWPSMGLFAADENTTYASAVTGMTMPEHPFSSHAAPNAHGIDASALAASSRAQSPAQDEVAPELVGQIAAHIGSLHLGPNGKLQYYGAATNSRIINTGKSNVTPPTRSQSMKDEVHNLLQQADLDKNVEEDLAHHFLDLFFSCHNACHSVVDPAIFWSARTRYRDMDEPSDFYSEVLDNMMCAVGASHDARYHSRLVTFPRTLAEFFADRAKTLLDFELDAPCVSTVQALILLSSHEAGLQRLTRSSMYSGMAMRSAFDLGLHVPAQPYVAQGMMSAAEAQVRQHTFWTSYIMDYHRSLTFGRPFTFGESLLRANRPNSASSEDELDIRICYQRLTLLDLVEPIIRALYGNTSMAAKPLQELSESCTHKMFAWKNELNFIGLKVPPEDVNTAVGAQLFVLHIEYHYLQILVHRPWTSRSLQPVPAQGPGFLHARRTCIASASEIAQLLCLFESRFGFRRIDVETAQLLPSAALILIFASISEHGEDRTVIVGHLNAIFRALDTLSNMFVSARVHLDSLLAIQQQWCAVYDHQRNKRDERDGRRDLGNGQKRARLR